MYSTFICEDQQRYTRQQHVQYHSESDVINY